MNEFPYGRLPDAYLNVKEAAKEPWRGITAWVQGNPYLIVDKEGDTYILEGENGVAFETQVFERWTQANDHSALVAASRLVDSPFFPGSKLGSFDIGNLIYFEKEWNVKDGETGYTVPLEDLTERFDAQRWSKKADLLPPTGDMNCPECGSNDIQPDEGFDHGIWQCHNCGKQGYAEEFESEAPDYDQDPRYENDSLNGGGWDMDLEPQGDYYSSKVAEGVNSFEYNLPPAGIHMRTHAAMRDAGLQARVHFPPGTESMFGPIPQVLDVPSADQEAVMNTMMLDNPEQYNVQVETPHDPNVVRELFDRVGGRHHGKTADAQDVDQDPTVDQKKALTCPRCGSHTLRAFPPGGKDVATIVCLTCGNEFQRDVFINPEASVKEAVQPLDPNMHAQMIGLMQQIEDAYKQGNTTLAQQLHQQMMALMDNPNTPLMSNPAAMTSKTANQWIRKRGDQWCIIQKGTGKELSCHASEEEAEASFRAMEMHKHEGSLQKEAPGKEHMKGVSPKRNRMYEDIKQSCMKEHPEWDEERCKEYAARTVNKYRSEHGETKGSSIEDHECGCDNKVDNSKLADSTPEYWLESLTYDPSKSRYSDSYWDGAGDPYDGTQVNLDQYEQGYNDTDPSNGSEMDYAHCPACDGPGVLLGQLGRKIHYRCRNCGVDFSHNADGGQSPQDVGQQRQEPLGEGTYPYQDEAGYGNHLYESSLEDAEKVNEDTLKAFKDSSGNPLEAGKLYMLNHPSYKVPDLVRILNLEDNRIEAAIASDEHGAFPIHITHDDAYSLDPYDSHHKAASGWSVIARKNFSAQEQRELIDENPKGKARNFDKLNLDGTHYQIKEEATDPNFLLGL